MSAHYFNNELYINLLYLIKNGQNTAAKISQEKNVTASIVIRQLQKFVEDGFLSENRIAFLNQKEYTLTARAEKMLILHKQYRCLLNKLTLLEKEGIKFGIPKYSE